MLRMLIMFFTVDYEKALKYKGKINLKYLKFFHVGPPRIGKSTTKLRLLDKLVNISDYEEKYKKKYKPESTKIAEWSKVQVSTIAVKISEGKTKKNPIWSILPNEQRQLIELYRYIYGISESDDTLEEGINDGDNGEKASDPSNVDDILQPNKEDNTNMEASKGKKENDEQKERIKKIIARLKIELDSKNQEELKQLSLTLMSMIDVGGQSAFFEFLPLLIHGPALYLAYFNLAKSLDHCYNDELYRDGEDYTRKSHLTAKDTVLQVLANVALSQNPARDIEHVFDRVIGKQSKYTSAFIVGTHADERTDNLNDIDNKIKCLIKDIFPANKMPVEYYDEAKDELIVTVDNKYGTTDIKKFRERVSKIIENEIATLVFPAHWLILGIIIHQEYEWITLNDCIELAAELDISEQELIDTVLYFLSTVTGFVLYQPKINSKLKDVIICNQQIMFDSITLIIEEGYYKKSETMLKNGKFNLQRLRTYCQGKNYRENELNKSKELRSDASEKTVIPIDELVKLLQYRHIVAEIPSEKDLYFMPAALPCLPEDDLKDIVKQHFKPGHDPCSLFIKFKQGYVPPGLFCGLVTTLIKKGLTEEETIKSVHRNFICFEFFPKPKLYSVYLMLMAHTGNYEVLLCNFHKDTSLIKTCLEVKSLLDDALSALLEEGYPNINHELCIKCPLNQSGRDHFIEVPKSGDKIICNKCRDPIKPVSNYKYHLCWIGQVCINVTACRLFMQSV